MKAEYILNAIHAMQTIENIDPWTDPGAFGRARAKLYFARIHLETRSGLNDIEIDIEKEAA